MDGQDLAKDHQNEAEATATMEPSPAAADQVEPTATLIPTPAGTPAPNTITTQQDDSAGPSTLQRIAEGVARIVTIVALILITLAIIGSFTWHWKLRGLRPGAAMFARVQRVGKWWGVRPDPTLTPVEYARELGKVAPAVRRPARIVADLYESEQYGPMPADQSATQQAKRAWSDMRNSMLMALPVRKLKWWRSGGRD
jgi:hypothetical protein